MIGFIILMGFLARMCGGGYPAAWLKDKLHWDGLPEFLFSLPFAAAVFYETGSYLAAAAACVWSWAWMETGHGVVLQWGRDPAQAHGKRRHMLTPFVNFLAETYGYEIGGVKYCRLFMAVKGFLIGLPVGGVPLAIMWPLSYEIGNRVGRNEVCEILSGVSAAIAIMVFICFLSGH